MTMFRSFTVRLALGFAGAGVLTATVTAILVNLAFGGEFAGYVTKQQQTQQSQLVATLADSYRRAGGWSATDLQAATPLALMSGGTVQVVDPSGRLVWDATQNLGSSAMLEMHRQMGGGGALGPENRLPVTFNGRVVGTAVVRLPAPGLSPADAQFHQSVNSLFIIGGLAGALLALAMGAFLARRATAPARELAAAARDLSKDRTRRVQVSGTNEFGEMGQAFNNMADAIEAEDRLRRSFAASVAHELRTPLTILRSQVEALQDHVVRAGPRSLASLHEEVMRLGRLVADLESLAVADAAGFSLKPVRSALQPLVQEVLGEFAGPFAAEGIRLESELGPVAANVDPGRMRQVLSNLLSNALKFTPEGGLVRVGLGAEAGRAVIRVRNSGPGIPAEDLPQVFDRFFRGRGARGAGSGIGLTVVSELVSAHGGTVDIESDPGTGTVVAVGLPLVPEPSEFISTSRPPVMVAGAQRLAQPSRGLHTLR
jgi:two-component system, OmpR family, sensor histidine kinase BaeS